jgi:hypothetical protein
MQQTRRGECESCGPGEGQKLQRDRAGIRTDRSLSQHEHENERPMRVVEPERGVVSRPRVRGHAA